MRRKSGRRRAGLPVEPAGQFYAKYLSETVHKARVFAKAGWRMYRLKRKVENAADRLAYRDEALLPASEGDLQGLELFNQTEAARSAVRRARAIETLTGRRPQAEAV